MNRLRLFMAQINPTVGDMTGNVEKILHALAIAKGQGADLVVFPEMAIPGYPPEDLLFRQSFIKSNEQALAKVQKATAGITAVVGFIERDRSGALYNTAAVFANKRRVGVYRKNKLPNYGVFDEKRYFSEGKGSFIFKLRSQRIGVTICEDIWQKDSYVYRKSFIGKVDLLINLSASPYHADKEIIRQKLVGSLAKRLHAHVLYLNLVGGQDELIFDGGSMVADPSGRIVARAETFQEDLYGVTLPVSKADPPKNRPLGGDEAVYKALVLGTHDYIRKNGFKKVLLGLSGGIDSALVARIAVDALGPANVLGVTMPSPYTSKGTYQDAHLLAQNLGIECLEFKISGIYKDYLKLLAPAFKGLAPNIAEENLQARIRGNLLMALSNKYGYLVLTTGNKSEMATGYCTLYGDMAGGFAVIKDVPKMLVFRLARWRNTLTPKNSIPESILRRPPTAELRRNQTDQDTLPAYAKLDKILEMYVERDYPLERIIAAGEDRKTVHRTARMVDLNEYKRRQAPPGIKITPRAFGRDRRMPITHRCAL